MTYNAKYSQYFLCIKIELTKLENYDNIKLGFIVRYIY